MGIFFPRRLLVSSASCWHFIEASSCYSNSSQAECWSGHFQTFRPPKSYKSIPKMGENWSKGLAHLLDLIWSLEEACFMIIFEVWKFLRLGLWWQSLMRMPLGFPGSTLRAPISNGKGVALCCPSARSLWSEVRRVKRFLVLGVCEWYPSSKQNLPQYSSLQLSSGFLFFR